MADQKVTELDELAAVPPGKKNDVWIPVVFEGVNYKVRLSVVASTVRLASVTRCAVQTTKASHCCEAFAGANPWPGAPQ